MLIAMVVIFAICWLPLNVVHMVAEFHRSELTHYKVLFLSTHVIAMSSTIYNPFLYSWLNDNFRKEFQQIIPCLFQICLCLNRQLANPQNNHYNTTTIGEGEYYNERLSIQQTPLESSSNGKPNGHAVKKNNVEHIALTAMKQNSVGEEHFLGQTDPNMND